MITLTRPKGSSWFNMTSKKKEGLKRPSLKVEAVEAGVNRAIVT